jgi:hypothetical protein
MLIIPYALRREEIDDLIKLTDSYKVDNDIGFVFLFTDSCRTTDLSSKSPLAAKTFKSV